MSSLDRIILDSLIEDLQKAKSTKERKELISEINELKQKAMKSMLIKLSIVGFVLLIIAGAISEKVQQAKEETSISSNYTYSN